MHLVELSGMLSQSAVLHLRTIFTKNAEMLEISNTLKGQIHPCQQINACHHPVRCTSFLYVRLSTAHPCLQCQPVNHRPPLSHEAEGRGEEKERGWMVGWNCMKLTAEALQHVEKYPPNSLELYDAWLNTQCSSATSSKSFSALLFSSLLTQYTWKK